MIVRPRSLIERTSSRGLLRMSAGSSERDLSTPQTPNPKPGQAFWGKGKKSVWQAWHAYQDVTETFVHIAEHPFLQLDTDSNNFQLLERLIVVLNDKSSPLTSVNEIRPDLLCQRNLSMDHLPATQYALLPHLRRGIYQAGIWTTSIETQQVVPSPQYFGWVKESGT